MAKNDRHLSEDEIAKYAARLDRLRRAHERYQATASGGSAATPDPPATEGSTGDADGQNPSRSPPLYGNEGDAALKRLLRAADKLSRAADKLNQSADRLGKASEAAASAGKDREPKRDAGGKSNPLGQITEHYMERLGDRLAKPLREQIEKRFGKSAGDAADEHIRRGVRKGLDHARRSGTKHGRRLYGRARDWFRRRAGGSAATREGAADLGSASTKARSAGMASEAAAGGEAAGAGAAGGAAAVAGPVAIGVAAYLAEKAATKAMHGAGERVRGAIRGTADRAGQLVSGDAEGVIDAGAEGAARMFESTGHIGGQAVAEGIRTTKELVLAFKHLHDAVKRAAEVQQQHNFRLAEASAAMASVQASVDIRDTFRNQEMGDRTAGSASDLSNSLGDLKDTTKSIQILVDNITNTVQGRIVDMLDSFLKPLDLTAQAVLWLANNIPGIKAMGGGTADEGGTKTFFDRMDEIRKLEEESRRRNDEWWQHSHFGRQRPGGMSG